MNRVVLVSPPSVNCTPSAPCFLHEAKQKGWADSRGTVAFAADKGRCRALRTPGAACRPVPTFGRPRGAEARGSASLPSSVHGRPAPGAHRRDGGRDGRKGTSEALMWAQAGPAASTASSIATKLRAAERADPAPPTPSQGLQAQRGARARRTAPQDAGRGGTGKLMGHMP